MVATSALDAVRQTFTGSVQVAFGGNTYTYTPSGYAICGAMADHREFWFDGTTLWLEDMASPGLLAQAFPGGGTGGGNVCDWDYDDHKWFVSVTEHIPDTPSTIPGDLDIIDSNGDELAENKETAVGGWVPLNNDNDNYNFPTATSLAHIIDKDESTQVVGENDLVPIKVTLPEQRPGSYFLQFQPGSGLRLWSSADKGTEYTSTFDLGAATTRTIWVEGTLADVRPRQHLLSLQVQLPGQSLQTVDQIKLTVYKVDGAMNVPGYAKHTYAAEVPGDTPRFVAGNMATVTAGNPVAHPNVPVTSVTAQVLWGAGADVGVYRVYPTADNNFWIDRQVNVVKVEFSAVEGPSNKLTYFNGPTAPKQNPTSLIGVKSSYWAPEQPLNERQPATKFTLTIDKIEAPLQGGVARGMRFIEAGFIQNSKEKTRLAVYDKDGTPKYRVSSIEGMTFLDNDDTTTPWYTPIHLSGMVSPGADSQLYPAVTLVDNDSPSAEGTDELRSIIGGDPYDVDRFDMRIEFFLYFAVRTRDDVSGSASAYTQRGQAKWWFDGSGTLNAAHIWTRGGSAENNGDPKLSEVTDGSVVPITTGTRSNQAASQETWAPRV